MNDKSAATQEFLNRVTQGSLFTHYFLAEGVHQSPDYRVLDETQLTHLLQTLQGQYLQFRKAEEPDEADTEDDLVQLILDELGFSYLRQKKPGLRAERPDYLLFDSESTRQQALKDKARQFQLGISILEAKRFERPLDRRGEPQDVSDPGTPSSQILRYLSSAEVHSNGKMLWGILTNGRLWRLYYQKAKSRVEGYLEFDLDPILNREGLFQLSDRERLEAFRLFYLFLRKDAFIPTTERPDRTFLEIALEEGKNYEERVTEDLKQKIFEDIFIFLAHGFVEDAERKDISVDRSFLDEVYRNVLTLLYRLLFILYAEDRDLLPVRDPHYVNYSLRKLRCEIERRLDEQDAFSQRATSYWDHLKNLFRIVNEGDPSLNVPVYNGGLFDSQAHPFLEQHAISDHWLAKALNLLSRDYSDSQHPRYINYRDLGVHQLGSIYEGLLEFKLRLAEEDLVVVKEKGKEIYLPKAKAIGKHVLAEKKKSELFVANDKSERKATGSYYTPDYIVHYIVGNTLGSLVKRIEDEFQKRAEELKPFKRASGRWKTVELAEKYDSAMKVLELKILDPAMGSGHFLVGAVDFLADRIVELLEQHNGQIYFGDERYESPLYQQIEMIRQQIRESAAEQGVELDETKLEDKHIVKRMVMKRCIYGVDLNEMAVELAKVSLWLNSFTVGAPLSFLDHHLKCGNSLIGTLDVKEHVIETSSRYQDFLRAVSNFLVVNQLTDAIFQDVEESHRLYEEAETWLHPFKQRFDAALAAQHLLGFSEKLKERVETFVLGGEGRIPEKDREEIAGHASQALQLAHEKHFFHWELEFPEVWYDEGKRRANPGFDAVIGNPPYVRQEQLKDKGYFKASYEVYDSVADLYVYFYEMSHRSLRQGGQFGMITSNKFMRAAYGKALRRYLSEQTCIKAIIDFGDLPVFPEVSAYQCIVLSAKPPFDCLSIKYLKAQNLDFASLSQMIDEQGTELPREAFQGENWQLMDSASYRILRKMEGVSVPLKVWLGDAKINYGVKTGFNEAFFIDEATRARLISEDPKSVEIIKPLVIGDDVKRYEIEFKEQYLIFTKRGIRIDSYPAIKTHLEQYKKRLIPCPLGWDEQKDGKWPGRKQGSYEWYEIQDTVDYYEDFEEPKTIYPVIAKRNAFAFDENSYFSNDKTFIIPGANLFVLGPLNSKLGFLWARSQLSWLRGGYLEYRAQSMEKFPIRRIFFTTPAEERQRLLDQSQCLYHEWMTKAQGGENDEEGRS